MQPRISLLTKAIKQLKFTESLRKKLIDSLGLPLRELIDMILESLIYCDISTNESIQLINSLLQIRYTVDKSILNSDSKLMLETYPLVVKFLHLIDRLDSNVFECLAVTIRDTFHFFQVFFKSHQMMNELINHLNNDDATNNDLFFNKLISNYLNCNELWYIEIVSHSLTFQEYLTNELQNCSSCTNNNDLTSSNIINSETFQQFIIKRKQRLLNDSIINKFTSYII